MSIRLESDLLNWIEEESIREETPGKVPVAVQSLIVRLALAARPEEEDLSRSVELTLQTFEKAEMLRILRNLERKQMINFVDPKGTKIIITDEQLNLGTRSDSKRDPTFVAITEKGLTEVKRQKLTPGRLVPEW